MRPEFEPYSTKLPRGINVLVLVLAVVAVAALLLSSARGEIFSWASVSVPRSFHSMFNLFHAEHRVARGANGGLAAKHVALPASRVAIQQKQAAASNAATSALETGVNQFANQIGRNGANVAAPLGRTIGIGPRTISNSPRGKVSAPDAILASGSWNNNTAGQVWSTAADWLGSIIADGAGSTGNFTFNITTVGGRTITIDGAVASRTLGIMNIGDTDGSSPYTIAASGGGTLTFDNSGSNAQLNQTSTSANNTISAPIILNSSLDITNASTNNLTLSGGGITAGTAGTKTITTSTGTVTSSGVIGDGSGVVAVTQNGPGTLALGTSANTYSGGTTLAGGKITIGGSGTPLGSGGLTLSAGTLVSSASRSATATNVVITADSALTTTSNGATVNMPFSGTLTGTGGTLTIRNDGSATTGQFDVRFSGGDYTMSRPIVIDNGAGGGTARLSDFNTTGTTHTYTGVISGNGNFSRSASVAGTGGTTVFTAANTYTGGTAVSQGGTLLANNTSGSGTGTGAVTVTGTGSTLGGTGAISGAVSIAGNNKVQGGDGTTGTTLTLGGALTLSDNSIVQLALGSSGAHSTLARAGAGTWTFDSNQAFTFIDLGATTGTYNNIITGLAGDPTTTGGWTITNPGFMGTFAFDSTDNSIDLTLTAVPEPSTWIAGALAVGVLGWSQRKRSRASGGEFSRS